MPDSNEAAEKERQWLEEKLTPLVAQLRAVEKEFCEKFPESGCDFYDEIEHIQNLYSY